MKTIIIGYLIIGAIIALVDIILCVISMIGNNDNSDEAKNILECCGYYNHWKVILKYLICLFAWPVTLFSTYVIFIKKR